MADEPVDPADEEDEARGGEDTEDQKCCGHSGGAAHYEPMLGDKDLKSDINNSQCSAG